MKMTKKMQTKARRYRIDMEHSFSPMTVLLIALGVIVNVLGARSVIALGLPLYLDNIGSALAAILGGPIPGMVTAFVSNYLGYFGEPSAIMFGVLTVTMAWLAAEFSQRGLFRKLRGYILMWVLMVAIGGAIGSVMGWYLYGKVVGGTIAAPYVFWLCDHGFGGFTAQLLGDVFLDMTDKALTLLVVAVVLRVFPKVLRGKLPLGYLYRCSDEELEAEYQKREEPYSGRSVFAKILWIITGALCMLAVVVTLYSTRVYIVTEYHTNHDTYALFGFVVQLIGLSFVIAVFAVILSGWMAYKTVKKPLDALVDQTVAFRNTDPEKWIDTDMWKERIVVRSKDEVQVLYEAICQSEETISQKVINIRESESAMRHLSETDLMTGLRNRGSGEKEIEQLLREGESGLFCLLDCDKFKNINDTYGHMAGDAVLVALAEKMQQLCQKTDVVMRLGGDEFAMYLRDIRTHEQAEAFFDRFFDSLQTISLPELKGEKIYVSLGVVFNNGETGRTFDDLYKRADRALYKSKETEGYAVNVSE